MTGSTSVSVTGQSKRVHSGVKISILKPANKMGIIDHVTDFGIFALKSAFIVAPALDVVRERKRWANPQPWTYSLGTYTLLGSAALLAHFYQTRRFVIEGKPNYPDIAKFMSATAWLAYCNFRYFNSGN